MKQEKCPEVRFMPYGIAQEKWDAAKEEARQLMIDRARVPGFIAYSDLAREIRSAMFAAHDQRLFHLIGEISTDENAAGRGMLSVIVVHKNGDREPGSGFFELAKELGRDTSDRLRLWTDEFKKVHAAWSRAPGQIAPH
jgi:hypothetical protein